MNMIIQIIQAYNQLFTVSPSFFFCLNVVLGLLVGSFLNVVALRVPAKQSIVFPSSHCPKCKHSLSALDLIPVFSYVLLRGKCRYCRQPFSARYASWELAAGLLFGVTGHMNGPTAEWFVQLFIISILIVITQTDLNGMIIPNKVIAAALVIGLPLRLLIHDQPISHYLIGFVAAGCLLYGIGIVGQLIFKKEALGGGDLKLFAFIGLMLGIKLTLLTLFIACLAGSIVGLLLIRSGILKRDEYISFGPFIALGAVLSCWWGETWIDWYLHLLLHPIKF